MVTGSLMAVLYLAALVSAYTFYVYATMRRQPPHPPGPCGWPIVGNLKVPDEPAFKIYHKWSEQYSSDVVRINVLGTNIVITNTLEASADLLDRCSAIYSNRPTHGMTMLKELCGFDWLVTFMQLDACFRDQRKVLQRAYTPQAIRQYRRVETRVAHLLLRDLRTSPEDFLQHTEYAIVQDLIYGAYGVEMKSRNDPLIATLKHELEAAIVAMTPGAFLVRIIPILKYIPAWLPGAEFRQKAKVWHALVDKMVYVPYNMVKELLHINGLPEDCAARNLLVDVISSSVDQAYAEYIVRSSLAAAYVAGTDTALSTLQSFFLAMTIYPEAQRKAQQEIHRVCHGQLPDFSDYAALPCVDALIKELLRWHPVVPLNIAHVFTQDDTYKGYHIPKGSVVLANIRAILHDPVVYPDPETFNPDRFLRLNSTSTGEYELDLGIRNPDAAFGFGRRICPGKHVAQEVLWITVASVLAVFDILRARDEQGREIIPTEDYFHGFICLPQPFTCVILPLSEEHEKLILSTVEQDA